MNAYDLLEKLEGVNSNDSSRKEKLFDIAMGQLNEAVNCVATYMTEDMDTHLKIAAVCALLSCVDTSTKSVKYIVFEITCDDTEEIFVGVTRYHSEWAKEHTSKLERGTHPHKSLQKQWDISGEESFQFRLMHESDINTLNYLVEKPIKEIF